MTLVIIIVLIVFIISFVTMTPFLDFVYYSVSRYWEISLVSAISPKSGTLLISKIRRITSEQGYRSEMF
jgi:hypothetical protein